jgi:hypothetical protein
MMIFSTLLNYLGRRLLGGNRKRPPKDNPTFDARGEDMIEFRPIRGRRMISKGLVYDPGRADEPDRALFRHL